MIILIIFRIQLSTSIGNAGDERPAGGSPAHARPIDWARDVAADRYNVIPGRTHARTRIVDALRSHRPRENDVDDGRRATGDRTARPSSDEQTDQRRFTERRTARRAVRYGRPTSFAPHHDYSYDEVYKSETVNTLSTNWVIVSYFYNTIFTPIRTGPANNFPTFCLFIRRASIFWILFVYRLALSPCRRISIFLRRVRAIDFTVDRTMDNASISSGSSTTSSGGAADGDELSAVLSRRQKINEALEDGKPVPRHFNRRASSKNVFLEFKEFSRKQINEYEATFKK